MGAHINQVVLITDSTLLVHPGRLEAIALRLEAIAFRVDAILNPGTPDPLVTWSACWPGLPRHKQDVLFGEYGQRFAQLSWDKNFFPPDQGVYEPFATFSYPTIFPEL